MPIVRVDKSKQRHRVQRAQDIAKAIAERDSQRRAVPQQQTTAAAPVDPDIPSAAPAAIRKDITK